MCRTNVRGASAQEAAKYAQDELATEWLRAKCAQRKQRQRGNWLLRRRPRCVPDVGSGHAETYERSVMAVAFIGLSIRFGWMHGAIRMLGRRVKGVELQRLGS